jgi:hypothetical protein
MVSSSIMSVKGKNGQIELYEDKIIIKRKGLAAKMTHWGKGTKEIPLDSITSVQLKEPGYITAGYIQFGQSGYSEDSGGLKSATKDENSVNFNKGNKREFVELKNRINKLRKDSEGQNSELGALERLKERFAEGEISEREFRRKRDILKEK